MPSLVEIRPVVLEKKMKMWKVYRQTDWLTDDEQKVISTHLTFQLRWAKIHELFMIISQGITKAVFCQKYWYFTLNFSGQIHFSISIKSIISLNLKTFSVKILCWLLVSLKAWPGVGPIFPHSGFFELSLTLRDVNKLTFRSKFEKFLSKNGKQISVEEL